MGPFVARLVGEIVERPPVAGLRAEELLLEAVRRSCCGRWYEELLPEAAEAMEAQAEAAAAMEAAAAERRRKDEARKRPRRRSGGRRLTGRPWRGKRQIEERKREKMERNDGEGRESG